MKALFFISISILLFLAGCSNSYENDAIREFIPGTYIRFSKHEFGTEYDTLIISMQNKSVDEFKIIRKWEYKRILDGNVIEPEYKTHITSANYDESSKLLKEAASGESYSFDTQQNVLFVSSTKYQKLK